MEDLIRELVEKSETEAVLNLFRKRWISANLQAICRMCKSASLLVDVKTEFVNITPEWLEAVEKLAEQAELDLLKMIETK